MVTDVAGAGQVIAMSAGRLRFDANPGAIRGAAAAWRDLDGSTVSTNRMIAPAAQALIGRWRGDDSSAYAGHQQRLESDITSVGTAGLQIAAALESAADALDTAQDQLSVLRAGARGLATSFTLFGRIYFFPSTDGNSAGLITALAEQADAIRTSADQTLRAATAAVTAGAAPLYRLRDTWAPRPTEADITLGGGINLTKPGKGGKGGRGGRRRLEEEWDCTVIACPLPDPPKPRPPVRPVPPGDDDPKHSLGIGSLIGGGLSPTPGGSVLIPGLGPVINYDTTRDPPGPIIERPRPPGDSPDWPYWPGEYPYPRPGPAEEPGSDDPPD